MTSLNKVMLIGRLGQDPELRYTPNQIAVATFSLATSDYRIGKDGQKQETTEWHRIVVWNKQAENCSKYLAKGRMVYVEGRIQTKSWDDPQSGQKKFSTEIIANTVQFLQTGQNQQQGASQSYGQGSSAGSSSFSSMDFPMSSGNAGSSFSSASPSMGGSDLDEIPF